MCFKTPKAEAPTPVPPPAPAPAASADVAYGKGTNAQTRKKLRTDLKTRSVAVPGATGKSGLNITKAG